MIISVFLLSSCASRRSTYYKIRGRDTIEKITKINEITIEEIIAANADFDPKNLKAGSIIYIPKEEIKNKRGLWDVLKDYRRHRQAYRPGNTGTSQDFHHTLDLENLAEKNVCTMALI
jgi:hypothetical protein